MKKSIKKIIDQGQVNPLDLSQQNRVKGGNGDTTDDIVIIDVVTP